MAHSVELPKLLCFRCTKLATHRVFNSQSAPMGVYCAKHSAERVAEIQAAEAKAFAADARGRT